jgi:tripartite-type tricarboxylate transporter receptor subunit TctC
MRFWLYCATAALLITGSAGAGAQTSWPTRPITIIVGYPAGSGIDVMARFLADGLQEKLGQPVIIENRAGAIGNAAARAVARAKPDGYTLLYTPNSTHAANIHLFADIGFDPVNDFAPVTSVIKHAFMLTIQPSIPANSVKEFIAYAKERPGQLNYGSGSATGLVAAELFKFAAGLETTHVPYKGMPQAYTDLMAGQIQYLFADNPVGLGMARSGRIKPLAVTTNKRAVNAEDIPTMEEAGLKDFDLQAWQGVFLPRETPNEIIQKLAAASNAVMSTDAAREYVKRQNAEPMPGSPEELGALVKAEIAKWGDIIKKAGITPR